MSNEKLDRSDILDQKTREVEGFNEQTYHHAEVTVRRKGGEKSVGKDGHPDRMKALEGAYKKAGGKEGPKVKMTVPVVTIEHMSEPNGNNIWFASVDIDGQTFTAFDLSSEFSAALRVYFLATQYCHINPI